MNGQRYPAFRIFLFFLSGILLANFYELNFTYSKWLLAGSLVLSFFFGINSNWFSNWSRNIFFGISLSVSFFALGVVISHWYSEKHQQNHYSNHKELKGEFLAELLEEPLQKERSYKCLAKLKFWKSNGETKVLEGKVLLYFAKDSDVRKLHYGDQVILKGSLNGLKKPMNPHEFDYKNYLNLKAIYAQAYLRSSSWKLVKQAEGFSLIRWSKLLRKELMKEIDGWNIKDEEKAITKALLLGYRYDIDDNLLKAYASAGATHVLAVSGLHVGIVYLMASYLLFFLKYSKKGRIIQTLLLVLLLWGFALLTGFSASVVRAACMFSFVAVGKIFNRNTSIYNTLLGSALLLLLIKPTYLFEVGFQLSYLAVFSIVWVQGKLEGLWVPGNRILKNIWAISTVSIAAQLGTFPLGLYYFHQFPSLFLVSNLIVIPLISLLMYMGLFGLLCSYFGWLPIWLIDAYGFLLGVMNKSVRFIEQVPGSLIQEVYVSRIHLVLLYVLIFMFLSWLFYGKYWRVLSTAFLIFVLIFLKIPEKLEIKQKDEIWIYSIKKTTALSYQGGNEFHLLADRALLKDENRMTFHIYRNIWANHAARVVKRDIEEDFCDDKLCKQNGLLSLGGLMLWMYKPNVMSFPKSDIWLVSQKQFPPETEEEVMPVYVVLNDEGVELNEKWLSWCIAKNIKLHSLSVDGAFYTKSLSNALTKF